MSPAFAMLSTDIRVVITFRLSRAAKSELHRVAPWLHRHRFDRRGTPAIRHRHREEAAAITLRFHANKIHAMQSPRAASPVREYLESTGGG